MPLIKKYNLKATVSVVIPCYNCAHTIARSVDSVLWQTLPATEIILVNDASTDNSLEIIRELQNKYPYIIKIASLDVNGGAAQARNFGWNIASCEYVAFLDSDDTWHPEKLFIQISHMLDNPTVSASGHFIGQASEEVGYKECCLSSGCLRVLKRNSILFSNPFSTPTVLVKRELKLRFPDSQRYSEDFALWLKLAFENYTLARVELVLAFVHKPLWGFSGLSSHIFEMERGEINNFLTLFRERRIGLFLMIFASGWSIIKFVRRLIVVGLQRLKKTLP